MDRWEVVIGTEMVPRGSMQRAIDIQPITEMDYCFILAHNGRPETWKGKAYLLLFYQESLPKRWVLNVPFRAYNASLQ